jgi:YfiH family protein
VKYSDLHENDYHLNVFPETDALITNEKGICLFVLTADCVPLVMYEPDSHAIAVIHAGWKGTVKKLAQKTALKMQELYGSNLANMRVGIAPAAGSCCYEIGTEVETQFLAAFPNEKEIILARNDKKYLDLAEANRIQLLEIGLQKENIEMCGICTICEHETFFSYRKEGGKTGRFGTGILLND